MADVCIPNIGSRERRRRLLFGVALLVLGALVAAFLIIGGVHPLWRLPLFGLFWAGATGIFQAREKT
jgi:hypothetical protein